jgi:uncharacterized protein YqeY
MSSAIKDIISENVKDTMRARDKPRLGILRLVMADFKRVEVDERIELDDDQIISILAKMVKQRKDSFEQYKAAERMDLADQEAYEISVIEEFLPAQLDEGQIGEVVSAVIDETGASSMKDMGKVMTALRPRVAGKADMGVVSALVRARLA